MTPHYTQCTHSCFCQDLFGSHLYQSNNKLAAYLTGEISKMHP